MFNLSLKLININGVIFLEESIESIFKFNGKYKTLSGLVISTGKNKLPPKSAFANILFAWLLSKNAAVLDENMCWGINFLPKE